eukprot:CAMPEP_0197835218 /NCGR_PEP_ID=MMETSP1437-20131217/25131_1 /TAXON_ID=49252 ORGANISM="Eucampia antarctica, Strain CCMP1452" /NCGR_SAMPLE_ID=MMETSP1437 /ASSEMBLY_ACC=CAM_ASM_001096 /LENGTH=714 /DNA_ID=CAMNT_0043440473 /DNA_START=102 /DNA_END=2246 /DNA_ORIENTATION=+
MAPTNFIFYEYFFLLFWSGGLYVIGKFVFDEYSHAIRKNSSSNIQFTLKEVFHYRLDYYFSSTKLAKPLTLLAVSFALIFVGAVLLSFTTGETISASTWVSWTYVADPGTHADATGITERCAAFFTTVGGMLVFALMIGIVSEEIGEKVDELKQGKARVIESNHTLILGWSDKALPIIEQISLANESEDGGIIVVLADEDKNVMESTLQSALNSSEHALKLHGTDVIFRTGNTIAESDLRKVSVSTARSIICLAPLNMDSDEADSKMLRQVLSLKAFGQLIGHVVVELQDVDNKCLIDLVAEGMTEIIVVHDVIGRLMIQCAREVGLAHVLETLIGFEEDEFYIKPCPELVGDTFQAITCRFDDAIPVGVKTPDGEITLLPDNSYIIGEEDQIMVLAEDNDTYCVNNKKSTFSCGDIPSRTIPKKRKEKLLFCGWRRDIADMIAQLDAYVSSGSELWLLNTVPTKQRSELLKDKGHKDELKLKNLQIKNVVASPIIRRQLKSLVALDKDGNATGDIATLDEFDSVLILADAGVENADMEELDSRSLASLLIIQDLQREFYERKQIESPDVVIEKYSSPISEILDTRTRSLLHVSGAKGYVMSNQIISSMMAQISEDRDMNRVLGELLSAEGCETCFRDISYFLDLKKETTASFWEIALRGKKRNELVVGYKPLSVPRANLARYLLNPPNKSEKREWKEGDLVVVFSHETDFHES